MGGPRHGLAERRQKNIGHPISSEELQDTEALANALALERAKAWVGAKEKGAS